ncbi:hypothetical protein [Methylopila sp. 73B]|uniref:hypothetical protein n=1 Tax=Methylopila sp. 73B TaxID=1120792 RepID=UPI00037A2891|nr:hypothetical protein [Methylopila sp. 73B]
MAVKTSDVGAKPATDDAGSKPANIPAATDFAPSGAPDQVVPDVDPSHPGVDADPRAGTSVDQNKVDFNDPTKSGAQVVAEQLGYKTEADKSA